MAAASTNPFVVGYNSDLIENELVDETNESIENGVERESTNGSLPESDGVTLDQLAVRLLKDNLLLTALELHTELLEAGRELPRLRDFFSNPANFERAKQTDISSPGLVRTSSVQTFDSLDFARYSDDGDRQESDKVAVLEFELRKAQETIKSLRAALTKAAEPVLPSPDSPDVGSEEVPVNEPIRPYERRALNFLVNEYLLNNSYKLTSVTFAEENENQDFEDWDDVGLNTAKPPGLLELYRDYGQHLPSNKQLIDVSCTADIAEHRQEESTNSSQLLNAQIMELENRIIVLTNENEFLSHRIKAMEREAETVKTLRVKSSTPLVSPITTPNKKSQYQEECHCDEKGQDERPKAEETKELTSQSEVDNRAPVREDSIELGSQSEGITESRQQVTASGDEAEPEDHKTDIDKIESDGNTQVENGKQSNMEPTSSLYVEVGSVLPEHSVTLDQNSLEHSIPPPVIFSNTDVNIPQSLLTRISQSFQRVLMSTAMQIVHDNKIVSEIAHITESEDKVVLMLGRCLPRIVPNVILAKREELIPLILCTAMLHPDPKLRDQLLNILFNLIKRPGNEQRQMILTGCVAFAKHVGPDRVETELLPQCWEQINNKYVERRLLVAEACGTLSPYIPHELRGSLVLSMLTQMLQFDKAEEVREAVVHSLGQLVLFIADPDKYNEGAQLLFSGLLDSSARVQNGVKQIFLPAFAMWALLLGKLESHLLQSVVDKLESLVKNADTLPKPDTGGALPQDVQQFCVLLQSLQQLVPFLFTLVILTGPFVNDDKPTEDKLKHFSVSSRLPEPSSELYDLSVIFDGSEHLAALVYLYEEYIGEEWYQPWDSFNWTAGQFIPQLLSLLNSLSVSSSTIVHQMSALFYAICKTFGRSFTVTKIKKRFQVVLNIPEEDTDTMISAGQTPLSKCTVPVYAAGVLGSLTQDEDRKELATFIKDLLLTLSLCRAPLDSLKAAVMELCLNPDNHELLVGVLWDGVVHTSASVRSSSAQLFELLIKGVQESLVSSRVVPALVTLASDAEITVRTSTISAFGTIMETVTDRAILDKVHMQFQTFMDDPMYSNQHDVHLELVATFGRVGPNTEPRFRDEFVLPRLAGMSAANSQQTNEQMKRQMALQLFEAYSALSCCFISDELIQEVMLPGLHYLHNSLQDTAPEMVNVVTSMIREFEDKVESSKLADRSASVQGTAVLTPGEKMLNRFKDVAQSKPTFSKIFGKK